MACPPLPGSPSYPLYASERDSILSSLKRRSLQVAQRLNQCDGIRCNPVEGALYAFPQITLPSAAVEAAKRVNKPADVFYCLALLEQTGICVVPGTGFGQQE
jgi:alanine transaminase